MRAHDLITRDKAAPGIWWPNSNANTEEVKRRPGRVRDADRDVPRIAALAPRHRVCVQAGGHVGLWPARLAAHFERVYTFEPDHVNWLCLTRNVPDPNVYPMRAVLGNVSRSAAMANDTPWSGRHYVAPEATGPVPMIRLDDLGLDGLDALLLDVEGAEFLAVQGAEALIRAHHPLVLVEDLPKHRHLGYGTGADIAEWLRALGYTEVLEHGVPRDRLFTVPADGCA